MIQQPPTSTLFPYTTLSDLVLAQQLGAFLVRLVRAPAFALLLYFPHADRHLGSKGEAQTRSEEHTSELQSRGQLVCRLLLEKKNLIKLAASCMTYPDDTSYT